MYVLTCRDENWFYAEVDTPPSGQIDFVLTYEQLLRRHLGVYQLSLPLGIKSRSHRMRSVALTRVDATRRALCERGFRLPVYS